MRALVICFLCATFVFAPLHLRAEQVQPPSAVNGASSRDEDASVYADGTRAVNEGRWQDAVSLFDRVAQMRGEHAEGAL
jgi:hypothetical protein